VSQEGGGDLQRLRSFGIRRGGILKLLIHRRAIAHDKAGDSRKHQGVGLQFRHGLSQGLVVRAAAAQHPFLVVVQGLPQRFVQTPDHLGCEEWQQPARHGVLPQPRQFRRQRRGLLQEPAELLVTGQLLQS